MPRGKKQALAERNGPQTPSRTVKVILSILVSLQMLAVTAEPLQFFTRSARGVSEATVPIKTLMKPYTDFAYLNHGYFFFAPEPGPSHLIECKLQFDEESESASIRFPDKNAQWPRLLYHRHFMLSEFLHQLYVEPVPHDLPNVDQRLVGDWRQARRQFEMIRNSMQVHLASRYGAAEATIERLEHRLPSSDEVLGEGLRLDDPSLYIPLPDAPAEPAMGTLPPGDIAPIERSPVVLEPPVVEGGADE